MPWKRCLDVISEGNGFRHRERLEENAMKFNITMKGRVPAKVVDYLLQQGEYAPTHGTKGIKGYRHKGYRMDPQMRQNIIM